MDWGPTLVRTVDLDHEQMLMFEARPRTRIKVLYGGVWLTEEGVAQDVFASSGDEVALRSRGAALLEGLGAARIVVQQDCPGRLARAWVRLGMRARRMLEHLRGRWQLGRRIDRDSAAWSGHIESAQPR